MRYSVDHITTTTKFLQATFFRIFDLEWFLKKLSNL